MKAHVVIGANYGDEGKGLITDYLSHSVGADIVVRFNGGAQAGHTVVHERKRHVFSHLSAGTFTGADTYLGPEFVCNPILFQQEWEELPWVHPSVFVHPDAIMTLPQDMLLNQFVETRRGEKRHGSVGVGFGEAIERSQHASLRLTAKDARDLRLVRGVFDNVLEGWVQTRAKQLGLDLTDEMIEIFESDLLVRRFMYAVDFFYHNTETISPEKILRGKKIVFEGAQGLALDQNSGGFPHVTRSNTGLKNVASLLREHGLGIDVVDVTYVTRPYLTRHGAGPLPGEIGKKPYHNVVDRTNVGHKFQGNLRFSYFSVVPFVKRIVRDLSTNGAWNSPQFDAGIAVTCCDQLDETSYVYAGDDLDPVDRYDVPATIASSSGMKLKFTSHGPRRDDVKGHATFSSGRGM